MRIYEASIAYNLVQLGDVDALNTPRKIAEYLEDAYAKTPYQETLWVICLDRKNKPLSRTMVTMGTLTCALAHPREIFKIAILASAAAIAVSHNLCVAAHRLCYVARRPMWSGQPLVGVTSLCAAAKSLHITWQTIRRGWRVLRWRF
ncbi:MAG: JAB domain-containing protein, partial [Opitutaceae bacterium]|nr:JAB domain-containing protein [Opitutaceae bacterium]